MSDRELVSRAQAGDSAAFAELYRAYFEPVRRYLDARLRNHEDALDAAQQVFVRLLESLPRYRPGAEPFHAWLYTVVQNLATDRLRRAGRVEPTAPDRLARLHEAWLVDTVDRTEPYTLDLAPLVERLPAPQQQVLLLTYVGGYRASEVGAILGMTADAVRHSHQRALRTLSPRVAHIH